jgi:hypothetical protein
MITGHQVLQKKVNGITFDPFQLIRRRLKSECLFDSEAQEVRKMQIKITLTEKEVRINSYALLMMNFLSDLVTPTSQKLFVLLSSKTV